MQSGQDTQPSTHGIGHAEHRLHIHDDGRIAIVGMACRFPGTAVSIEAYWKALVDGENAVGTVPSDRWSLKRFFHPQPGTPGRAYVDRAAFLSQPLDRFDAAFFRISPREAMLLDPQQRLLLEVAWEALEESGLAPTIRGSLAGVYIGGFMLDHLLQLHGVLQRDAIAQHTAVAHTMSMLSNRLSHAFDLRGPSLSVDTACSSSLVALHLGCRALLANECTVALCGGVNVMARPETMITGSQAALLSRDGLCKAFDDAADGYGRGEGAGVLVLKRLTDALRDGDTIHAVIAGTGVNQDGHTDAITSPNPAAQCALMMQVQHDAGIVPDEIQYVEAHGTGTQAGDLAESYSIGACIATRRSGTEPLWIGSAKTSIGHLEAAAGVASVIKTVLALEHRMIAPHLNFRKPNSAIDFESMRLRIPLEPEPWPRIDGPAGAAVNGFGYGGTNAHVILLEAPPTPCIDVQRTRPSVFPLSAATPRALASRVSQFAQWFSSKPEVDLNDVGYTQSRYRPHYAYRTAFVARDANHLREQLKRCAGQLASHRIGDRNESRGPEQPKIAFVYTGMGIQFRGMGASLLAREPMAKALLDQCEATWLEIGGAPFASLLTDPSGNPITAPEQAQVANFVLQLILTEMAAAYGLRPTCYVGHSVGEIAAAYASNSLSLESALRIVYHRSRLMTRVAGRGAMLAAALSPVDLAPYLVNAGNRIEIAAFNGPHSVTLAGDADAIGRVSEEMSAGGVFNRRLNTDVAYHSRHIDALEGEFKAALDSHAPQSNTASLYSSVVAARIDSASQDSHYWWRNAREPVRWGDTLAAMLGDGVNSFVEIGPYPVLARTIVDVAQQAGKPAKTFALQGRGQDSLEALLNGVAQLYCAGADLDWPAHYPAGRRVALPPYPWDRERLWSETGLSAADRLDMPGHPLLRSRADEPQPSWDGDMACHSYPYLTDHVIDAETVLPAAVAIEMALAAHPSRERPVPAIDRLTLHHSVSIDDSPLIRLQVDSDGKGFAIYTRSRAPDAPWNRYASGVFGAVAASVSPAPFDRAVWCASRTDATEVEIDDFYARVNKLGFDFGPSFHCLRQITIARNEAASTIELEPAQASEALDYFIHPCLWDGALQTLLSLVLEEPAFASKMCLPVSVGQIRFFRNAGTKATCRASIMEHHHSGATGAVTLYAADGAVCAELTGIAIRTLDAPGDIPFADADEWTYETIWERQDVVAEERATEAPQTWIVFCDASGIGQTLIERARAHGTTCIGVYAGPDRGPRDHLSFTANRGSRDDIRQILKAIGPRHIDGIVYLWGVAHEHRHPDATPCNLSDMTGLTDVLDLVHVVQELDNAGHHERVALAVLSLRAQAVRANERQVGPGQQSLISLMHVMRAERPTWHIKSIDIDRLDPATVPQAVLTEWSDRAEVEVAFRGGERYVSRIVRTRLAGSHRAGRHFRAGLLDGEGGYLVSGGSSGLGLMTAQWLAEEGAKHIAILSRRGPTDAFAHETLAKLQAGGVAIWILKCDVADAARLRDLLARLKTVMPPVRGVVHAAATLEDASLDTLEDAKIERVFAAKAFGAWNLHSEFKDIALDFFITYSSISALVGNPGQAAYAAANGFLEGLVRARRSESRSGMNVHWGPIQDIGMVARSAELQGALDNRGLRSIPAKSGLMVLERALEENRASLSIFDLDWPRWRSAHSNGQHDPRLTHLLDASAAAFAGQADDEEPLMPPLDSMPSEQRWPLVYSIVTRTVCNVLRIGDPARVTANSRLNELGLDSLMAAELARNLVKHTGIPVSPLALLRGLSVAELSGYIVQKI